MSTLAELPVVVGFFSYSREDDEAFKGTLSALRDSIHRELSAQLGRSKTTFRLWQDQAAIAPGKLWESEINAAVDQAVFFIPIVTPRAVSSKYCKFEFGAFLAREKGLGRNDLVFPILYISVPALENEAKWRDDPVLSTIALRQYVDWRTLRHLDVQTTAVREQIERLCSKIVEALNEPWVSPEERLREAGATARQQAEDEARRLEAEAKRRVAEEEARRRAEAGAKRRAEEEEARRRAEAEGRQRAEEERSRQEAEAKRLAEQEEAFAAAKRADDISAFDAFLANHRESRHTAEARTLREALLARDEGCKAAMTSDDPAVLKAFLRAYPMGAPAEQVRGRLRSLEPQTAFGRHRKVMAAVLLLVLLGGAVAGAGLWLYQDQGCTGPRKLADHKFTDFTLVNDVAIGFEPKPRDLANLSSSSSLLQKVNDCAASCRTRPWCKAFALGDEFCAMWEDFKTHPRAPSGECEYWFRRK
jgi:TIR domain